MPVEDYLRQVARYTKRPLFFCHSGSALAEMARRFFRAGLSRNLPYSGGFEKAKSRAGFFINIFS
jgi:hypothetical protein